MPSHFLANYFYKRTFETPSDIAKVLESFGSLCGPMSATEGGKESHITLILFHLQSNCLHLKNAGLACLILLCLYRMAHFNSFVVSMQCYCIYLLMQRTEKNIAFQNVLFPMICPSCISMGYLYFSIIFFQRCINSKLNQQTKLALLLLLHIKHSSYRGQLGMETSSLPHVSHPNRVMLTHASLRKARHSSSPSDL